MDQDDDLGGPGDRDALFSLTATENAEIVGPGATHSGDSLWTVSANRSASESDSSDGPFSSSEDPTMPPVPPPFGIPYRSPIGSKRRVQEPLTSDDLWDDRPQRHSQDAWIAEQTWIGGQNHYESASSQGPSVAEDASGEDLSAETLDSEDPAARSDGYDRVDHDGLFGGEAFIDADDEDHIHGETGGWSGLHDSVGSVFRSDPVQRDDDIIDHVDEVIPNDPPVDLGGPSPFTSGRGDAPGPESVAGSSHVSGIWSTRTTRPSGEHIDDAPESDIDERSPGFDDAIRRLATHERERATVSLLIVGAILDEGERVLGLVVGQMLGRPAVIVLSDTRVVIVNDRQWQPVVDVYALDSKLEIRGRYDRNVAAIGVSDGDALSMVDGVFDVQSAVDLVTRIRSIADETP